MEMTTMARGSTRKTLIKRAELRGQISSLCQQTHALPLSLKTPPCFTDLLSRGLQQQRNPMVSASLHAADSIENICPHISQGVLGRLFDSSLLPLRHE
jgi:hypothetical protein